MMFVIFLIFWERTGFFSSPRQRQRQREREREWEREWERDREGEREGEREGDCMVSYKVYMES